MPKIGDLVVGMGLDSAGWVRGVIEIQNQSKGLQGSLEQLGGAGGLERLGNVATRGVEIAMKGAKGDVEGITQSILGLAPAIGAAFGPPGIAIGSIVSTLGTALLPKFFEVDEATKKWTESIGTANQKLGEAIEQSNRLYDQQKKLKDLAESGTAKDVAAEQERAQERVNKLEQARTLALAEQQRRIADANRARAETSGVKGLFGIEGSGVGPADEAVRAVEERLKSINKQLDEARRLQEKLNDVAPIAEAHDEQKAATEKQNQLLADQEKLREQNVKWAQALADQLKTPEDKLRETVDRLKRLQGLGEIEGIGSDTFEQAMQAAFNDFERSLPKTTALGYRAAGSAQLGSAEALRTINESRHTPSAIDPQEKSRKVLEEMRELLRRQLEIEQDPPQQSEVIPVQLH